MLLSSLLLTPILNERRLHKLLHSRNGIDNNRSLNTKTITIKKNNKRSKQYNLRGEVRDPQLVLILKMGKTWGPVKDRTFALNFATVFDKQFLEVLSKIHNILKVIGLNVLAFLAGLVVMTPGGYHLIEILEDYYSDVHDLDLTRVDPTLYLDHLGVEMGDSTLYLDQLGEEMNDSTIYLDHLDVNQLGFEMGLDIPFISELSDLNCDIIDITKSIAESKESVGDIGWAESTFPLDWLEGFEIREIPNENISNIVEENIRNNKLAHLNNSQYGYDILDIDSDRYIITNQAIFEAEWLQTIRNLAVDIKVEIVSGNKVTTLTIDTEVANLLATGDLLSGDFLSSGNSLLSGSLHSSVGSEMDYENQIRAIRTEAFVINSPELREMMASISQNMALTILDVNPASTLPNENLYNIVEENTGNNRLTHLNNDQYLTSFTNPEAHTSAAEQLMEIEWRNSMRVNWRERLSILFSNQNPGYQPMPSWHEVPTRPTEPWNIEQWERDNVVRSRWAERLNGGYEQINIVTNESMDDYYSTDWFDNGYEDPQNLIGYDIFDEDDLGLNRLFDDS